MTDRSIRRARGLTGILVMTALVASACSAGGSGAALGPPAAATPSAATSVAPEPSAAPSAGTDRRQHHGLQRAARIAHPGLGGRVHASRPGCGDPAERRRHGARQPARPEGAASPADVFLTENSPAMALVEKAGLFAPVEQTTLDQVPAAVPAVDGRLDRHRGALDGLRLQPDILTEDAAARIAPGPPGPAVAGPLGGIARVAPTSRRSSARCWRSRARRPPSAWLAGMKTNVTAVPGQSDGDGRGQRR